ncbi:hypothetical protein P5G50_07540 [Leifsonia sp. F6_8S_P_1B]|uniref:Signal transduction histidine kinase n=1 Tax=Leifsonia williamsii TaxID=3035919 RepID=A0ABT8KA17_9MICO|nr:hypothetical protein [Leifsonia williamsii]MDN4614300.1 hypothetical protein [Leifsonia williamsii]
MTAARTTGLAPETLVRLRSAPVERTPQRLDPLGAQSAWLLLPLVGLLAVGYALFSTLTHRDQLRDPALAGAAVVLLVLGVTAAAVRARPGAPLFGRWTHAAVLAVVLGGACLFDAAVWGRNERIQDDWGQVAVALLLAIMPLYRPVLEVLGAAVLSAAVLGTLAALQAPSLIIATDRLVYASVAATPVIALACAGAGYAWTMTGETLRWRQLARAGQARLEAEQRQTARRMIEQERITALNVAAVPFLAGLLAAGEVTAADRATAGRLAEVVRTVSVAAVERTWLDDTIMLALAARRGAPPTVGSRVDDPDRLDRALTEEQRAIVGALVATVAALPGLDTGSLRVAVSRPEQPQFVLTARVEQPSREVRRELVPFVGALRSVSFDARLAQRGDDLVVRFAYAGSTP